MSSHFPSIFVNCRASLTKHPLCKNVCSVHPTTKGFRLSLESGLATSNLTLLHQALFAPFGLPYPIPAVCDRVFLRHHRLWLFCLRVFKHSSACVVRHWGGCCCCWTGCSPPVASSLPSCLTNLQRECLRCPGWGWHLKLTDPTHFSSLLTLFHTFHW